MISPRPLRRLATLVVAGTLVLSGCGLLGGDDDGAAGEAGSATPAASRGALKPVGFEPVGAKGVRSGGTLRLATQALPENFNPQHSSNDQTDVAVLLEPTAGSAIRITADGGWEVDQDYAESVEVVDKSPLQVEVKLNPDAVWQDGAPIRADDMVQFWKAQNGSDDAYEVLSTEGYEDIESVDPGRDGLSYTVTFDEPTVDWPRYVYPRLPASVSKSAKSFNSGSTSKAASSNGPYVTQGIDRKTGRVVQVPNPRWWGAKPRLKKIVWQAATPADQLASMAAGDLDAIDVPNGRRTKPPEGATLLRSSGTEWTQLTMNGASGPLADVDVRRAIAAGLDRKALAAASSQPVGAPAEVLGSFILLPGQQGYTDQSGLIAPDRKKAEKLLDDAGWKLEGNDSVRTRKGEKLILKMPVPATTSTSRQRAAMIAEQLRPIGIGVERQSVPDQDFFASRIVPLDFDLATFVHTGGPFPVVDAKALFYPIDSGQNFTGVGDDRLAGAWDKAIAALDDAQRVRAVKGIDERLFRDVPIIPLGVVPHAALVSRRLANYGPAQFVRPDWTQVGFRVSTP